MLPTAIFTAGQPGLGKSMIVRSVTVNFQGTGYPAIKIDPDEIRPDLSYMRDRIARGDLNIPQAAITDACSAAARIMELATEKRVNTVYDGTLSNLKCAQQSVDYLQAKDYRVEIHRMAVAPDLSHASTYNRRELEVEKSPTNFGCGVDDGFHDRAVNDLVDTIEKLQAQGKVDAIVLYDREHNILGSTRYEDGR